MLATLVVICACLVGKCKGTPIFIRDELGRTVQVDVPFATFEGSVIDDDTGLHFDRVLSVRRIVEQCSAQNTSRDSIAWTTLDGLTNWDPLPAKTLVAVNLQITAALSGSFPQTRFLNME